MKTKSLSKDISDLEQVIAEYLNSIDIQGQKIAVACSAGIDSNCLLSLVRSLHPANLIYCLHLDHKLRSDSHKARLFLEDLCKLEPSINFIYQELQAGEINGDEDSARQARYQFYEKICKQEGIQHLLLAHNLNDQIETILFRIFRGTNSAGLQGMPAERMISSDITIHRPLLNINRESIEDYIKSHNIEYIEDSSNSDSRYARNRIRNMIIPEALKINPQILGNISSLSHIINEEQGFINRATFKTLEEIAEPPWDLAKFRSLERIIQRRILEIMFTTNIAFVNDFLEAIETGGFHKINFAKGKYFTIKQKQIHLEVDDIV